MEKVKKNDELEHRSIIGRVEIRADSEEDSDSRLLTGYAISYNDPLKDLTRDFSQDLMVILQNLMLL